MHLITKGFWGSGFDFGLRVSFGLAFLLGRFWSLISGLGFGSPLPWVFDCFFACGEGPRADTLSTQRRAETVARTKVVPAWTVLGSYPRPPSDTTAGFVISRGFMDVVFFDFKARVFVGGVHRGHHHIHALAGARRPLTRYVLICQDDKNEREVPYPT